MKILSSRINSNYQDTSHFETWEDVYDVFEDIVDKFFPDEATISREVDRFYQKHKDDPNVVKAYQKWCN